MNRRQWLRSALSAAVSVAVSAPRRARSATSARVVIVGGGFAGSSCALQLRRLDPALELLLIDPTERYTTCPMSNEVIVGTRPLASLELTREGLRRAGIRIVSDRVTRIDPGTRGLQLAGGGHLTYDRLVVAPGIRFLWNRIEGLSPQAAEELPHAWMAGEQTARLAAQLRSMPDGGVVAISVPAGPMRCPPAPYERASLMAHYLKTHKPRSKLLIFDANNYFPKQPQFTDAWTRLYPGLIEWIPMTQDGTVERVDAHRRILYTAGAAHRVSVANVIPPQAPSGLAPSVGLAADHGWCPVDALTFESTHVPGIHVIGDACIADAMPKSASAAVSQAAHCAAAIAALLSGRDPADSAFDSVCYAHVSPSLALAFPGHFAIRDGRIAAPEPPATNPTAMAHATAPTLDVSVAERDSAAAEQWYAGIRHEAFAL